MNYQAGNNSGWRWSGHYHPTFPLIGDLSNPQGLRLQVLGHDSRPIQAINRQGQIYIRMVTHSATTYGKAKQVLFIRDGILYHQLFPPWRQDRHRLLPAKSVTLLTAMASRGE